MSTGPVRTVALIVLVFSMLVGCATVSTGPRSFNDAMGTGNQAVGRNEFDSAIKSYSKALEIAEQYKREADSTNLKTDADKMSAMALKNIGLTYVVQGKYAEAEPYFARALTLRESVLDPQSTEVADVLNDLGLVYRRQGRLNESLPLFERAARIYEKAGQERGQSMALGNIGKVYIAQGRYGEAESTFRNAFNIVEKKIGPNPTPTQPEFPILILRVKEYADSVRKAGRTGEADQLDDRVSNLLRQFSDYTASLRKAGRAAEADRTEARLRKMLSDTD